MTHFDYHANDNKAEKLEIWTGRRDTIDAAAAAIQAEITELEIALGARRAALAHNQNALKAIDAYTKDLAPAVAKLAPALAKLRFVAGQTYEARSACDYDCIFTFEVVRRSAKSVWIKERDGSVTRRGIKQDRDGEWCLPCGNYSMAPVIRA